MGCAGSLHAKAPPPPPPCPDAVAGSLAAEYELGKQLGTGAFSTVFHAKARSSSPKMVARMVAVKRLTKASMHPEATAGFFKEVAILSLCSHPAIMGYTSWYDEPDYFFVITELVSGGELFDKIAEKETFDEHEAREVVKTTLEAIAYLHQRDIMHRDLKPDNLLLADKNDDSSIKLADFGFATISRGRDQDHVCGTPSYVAPEIVSQSPKYGREVDVWALGVVTYVLLGGYAPFAAEVEGDRDALFTAIREEKLEFHEEWWSEVTDGAQDLVRQMLIKAPSKRPAASALLTHAWLKADQTTLRNSEIDTTKLKEWNAKRKFKGAGKAVMAMQAFAKPQPKSNQV